jgi:hypothetical protein
VKWTHEDEDEALMAEPVAPETETPEAEAPVPAPETEAPVAPEEDEVTEITDEELQEIIAELEAEAAEDEMHSEGDYSDDDEVSEAEDPEVDLEELFSELTTEDEDAKETEKHDDENHSEIKAELAEAYSVINKLRAQINEVNLLNAKLLYTNNLFKKFNLNEAQKLKVVENFDRAKSLREVKLVFSTISENLNAPKKVFKESFASKATGAKSTLTEQIVPEKNEFIARMQKLANISKK